MAKVNRNFHFYFMYVGSFWWTLKEINANTIKTEFLYNVGLEYQKDILLPQNNSMPEGI